MSPAREDQCKAAYDSASWKQVAGERDLQVDAPDDQPQIKEIQHLIEAGRKKGGPDPDCWDTFLELHTSFDLYSIEFDDQGWPAERPGQARLKTLITDLEKMVHEKDQPLSIIIYTHGWHHSAAPDDTNVIAFRQLLEDASRVEHRLYAQPDNDPCCSRRKSGGAPSKERRIVGIYVGWRGDSLIGPGIDNLSIWDRKHTAETVALGSVQEFFALMHGFFLAHACHLIPPGEGRDKCCENGADVRMLTVGHSFGGLITYRALAPRLILGVSETTYSIGEESQQDFAYSYGDLTVLINPAFEATRFEALAEAAACRRYVKSDRSSACRAEPRPKPPNTEWTPKRDWQLPVLIVATSRKDRATGWFFPGFRRVTTWFERARGPERTANIEAIGWDARYQTHSLIYDPKTCADGRWSASQNRLQEELGWAEVQRDNGYKEFDANELTLKDCLQLKKTTGPGWEVEGRRPPFMPLWVIQTDKTVIKNHNDFLNPHFVDFVRQIYFAMLLNPHPLKEAPQGPSEPPPLGTASH